MEFQGVQRKPCTLSPFGGDNDSDKFLTLLQQGKFFSFFALQLCSRDLRIQVCVLTGYNILDTGN